MTQKVTLVSAIKVAKSTKTTLVDNSVEMVDFKGQMGVNYSLVSQKLRINIMQDLQKKSHIKKKIMLTFLKLL